MTRTTSGMTVRFWGVRGSVATSGPETLGVGGNTSCVEVRAGGELIVLDAGTGIRPLGRALVGEGPRSMTVLFSHFHWDHLQGLPFFAPAYIPGYEIALVGPERCAPGGDVRAAFDAQMRAPHFPVGLDAMRARLSFQAVAAGAIFRVGEVTVQTAAARHPNGCLAYRIEWDGHSVVYATDTEHDAASGCVDENLVSLARGAGLLILDAQYTEDEYHGRGGQGPRRGWGHSTPDEALRLADAAGVHRLVLFHHDPAHDDVAVARMEAAAAARRPGTVAAREGQAIEVSTAEDLYRAAS